MLLMTVWTVAACGLVEVGTDSGSGSEVGTGSGGPGDGGADDAEGRKHVWYAVAVDYPEGYDWRSDMEPETVKCSLVVFANGIPVQKVPVGERYEVSPDPDMHRIIDGRLYTDYSTDNETVIKRDGEPLVRYPGREMILQMVLDGENLYTLGQARDGGGFSLRRDGEVLVESETGYAFTHLQRCEDGFSFAYYEVVGSGDNVFERYYHYLAGEVCQVAVREDVKKVWDIVFIEDTLCYLASVVGASVPVLVVGDKISALEIPLRTEVKNCRFLSEGDGMSIEGMVYQRRRQLSSSLWDKDALVRVFPAGYTVASSCVSEGRVSCVLNASREGAQGIIYNDGETWMLPEGYISMGGHSMVMIDGKVYAGLTSQGDESPAVWADNEIKPLKINGFISHMSSN